MLKPWGHVPAAYLSMASDKIHVVALQGGQYRQGLLTDAAFLAAQPGNVEDGIQAVLTQLVQSQGKWDIPRDVQVRSVGSAVPNHVAEKSSLQCCCNIHESPLC